MHKTKLSIYGNLGATIPNRYQNRLRLQRGVYTLLIPIVCDLTGTLKQLIRLLNCQKADEAVHKNNEPHNNVRSSMTDHFIESKRGKSDKVGLWRPLAIKLKTNNPG